MRAEAIEGVVDGLHPPALPHVGSLPELLHLHLGSHPPSALQQRPAVRSHPRGQLRGAVRAAIRKTRGGRGKGQVADVVVPVAMRCFAVVFAVIVLKVTGEKVHIVVQEILRVQGGVSGGLVCEELVIVEVRRRRKGGECGERLQDAVHVILLLLATTIGRVGVLAAAGSTLPFTSSAGTRGSFMVTGRVACRWPRRRANQSSVREAHLEALRDKPRPLLSPHK